MARARTTRRTDDSKKWYAQLGYVLFALIATIYILISFENYGARAAGYGSSMVILTLGLIGLTTYPALFKDAMYLSRSGYTWTPAWWKYIGFGLLTPVAVFYASEPLGFSTEAGAFAIIAYTLSTVLMNVIYLYNRHGRIGRP